ARPGAAWVKAYSIFGWSLAWVMRASMSCGSMRAEAGLIRIKSCVLSAESWVACWMVLAWKPWSWWQVERRPPRQPSDQRWAVVSWSSWGMEVRGWEKIGVLGAAC